MDFDVNVRERILRPVNEVFAAVVDPDKMSNYFISGASGPLKPRTKVVWEFADVGAKVSIDVLEVEENRKIVWESSALGPRIRTTIQFAPDGDNATVVTVTESRFPLTEERQTGLGPERRMDLHLVRPESLCAIRNQSPYRAQQEAYGRRKYRSAVHVMRGGWPCSKSWLRKQS